MGKDSKIEFGLKSNTLIISKEIYSFLTGKIYLTGTVHMVI